MNSSKKFQVSALSALIAAAVLAGCSGGGSKSSPVPSVPNSAQSLGAPVNTQLTFRVDTSAGSSSAANARNPQYIPATAGSIVIKYAGDNPTSTPVPGGGTIPASAITAATINVNTGAGGNCTAVGSALTCTVSVSLPVGVLDLYIQAYTGTNGSGTLLASSASVIQLNSNGTFTAPGTTTAATPVPASANIAGASATVTLNGGPVGLAAAPALPIPNATPTASVPVGGGTSGTFTWTAPLTASFKGSDGTAIGANNPIAPVTITDADTSGNTCLVYLKTTSTGGSPTTATPCPVGSPNSITLTNTSDTYLVQYNNKFVPAAGFNITATVPNSQASATPAPIKVTVTAATAAKTANVITATKIQTGAIVYDPTSAAVYTGTNDTAVPLVKTSYSSTSGYGTPVAVNATTTNGTAATALTNGGATNLIIGPDGNIWFTEFQAAASATQYVAVYAVNAAIVNPGSATGASASSGSVNFGEYKLTATAATGKIQAIATVGGYIYAFSSTGEAWRINPATGSVNPNKGTAYIGNAATTAATVVTTAAAGAFTYVGFNTNAVTVGSNIFIGEKSGAATAGNLVKMALDTTATPSGGGVCTATTSICIAAGTQSPQQAATQPVTLSTDGTNVYVVDDTGNLYSVAPATQSFTPAVANGTYAAGNGFPGVAQTAANEFGGLAQGADGWFWTQVNAGGGAAGIASITSGTTLATAANAACISAALTSGQSVLQGPDKTVLFAPVFAATTGGVCGVIY